MRTILKNLPAKLTEKKIKDIFEEYGIVTDIYFLKKGQNTNRGVCFFRI